MRRDVMVTVLVVVCVLVGGCSSSKNNTPGAQSGSLPAPTQPSTPGPTAPGPLTPGVTAPLVGLPPGFSEGPNAGPASLSGSVGQAYSGRVVAVASGQCGCTATIDWGDGSGQSPATARPDGGGVDVDGTHTYTRAGTYSIVVYLMMCASECHGPLVRDAVQQTIIIT